jgi:exocyst complex component 2
MALDIVKLYISLMSEFFTLSDMAVSPSSNSTTMGRFPANSHSLATAHHLMKIMGEIQETVNELNSMEISNEASVNLKSLLESVKWKFDDVLINTWIRGKPAYVFPNPVCSLASTDAKFFYHLETWAPSASDPATTVYLVHMETFQRHVTTAAYKIAGGVDLSSSSLTKQSKQSPIPTAFISKITKAFLDSLYAYLDGMVTLASNEAPPVTLKRPVANAPAASSDPIDLLDLSNTVSLPFVFHILFAQCVLSYLQDVRLLLVLSNFSLLSSAIFPSMINQLESAFGITIFEERQVWLCCPSLGCMTDTAIFL